MLGAAVCLLVVLATWGVAPSRANAGISPLEWTGVTKAPNSWQAISQNAYGWFDESGVYRGRWMTESAFGRMAARAAYGVQSLGTGVGTGYSGAASDGAAIAGKLKTVGTTAGTIAAVRALKGDTMGLMSRLKSFGVLKALGSIALAATAFEVGWKVGGKLSSLFGFDSSEDVIPGTFIRVAASESGVEAGETLPKFSGTSLNVPAPTDGFVVGFECKPSSCGTLMVVQPHAALDSGGKCQDRKIENVPTTATFIQTEVVNELCSGITYPLVSGVYFDPLTVSHLPGESQSPPTTIAGAAQTPENAGPATEKATACLAGLLGCDKLPGWWWNHDPEAQEDTENYNQEAGLEPSDPLQVRVPSFGRHEKYTSYEAKLEGLELVPEAIELPEGYENPSYGPEEVTQVNPKVRTQLQPEAVVKVRYNPSTATETGPGGESEVPASGTGPWSPPAIPAIDLSPLMAAIGCDTFPFGIFCWIGDGLTSWGGSGTCPSFSVPIHNSNLEVDFCEFEPAMVIIRPVIVVLATFTLALMFAYAALGIGGGNKDD